MMKKLKFLMLLGLPMLFGELRGQNYIPILSDTAVWWCANTQEFGDIQIYQLTTGAKVVYNEKTYTQIQYPPPDNGIYLEIREDTSTQKVYSYRGSFEELIYDFNLIEGDSIELSSSGTWFYVDSIRYIDYFSVKRKTIYFSDKWGQYFPVWIEGIGSTAGIDRNYTQPILYYWNMPELLCCYYNDNLVFQSTNGNTYGCTYEYYSPCFQDLFFTQDTLHLSDSIFLLAHAYDFPLLSGADMEIEITDPLGGHIQIFPEFYSTGVVPDYYGKTISAHDLEQIRGNWYISGIHLEDSDGNITNYSYLRQNAPDSFYFDMPGAVSNLINTKFTVYPNPASYRLFLSGISRSEISKIRISSSNGVLMQSITDTENGIDIRNLPPGVYFVEITTKLNNRINLKFFKLKI
jgi:hypothetical protein